MGSLHDDDLDRALDTWRVPSTPSEIETKTLAAYRAEFRQPAAWWGLLGMRVSIPLPALVAAVVFMVALSIMVLRFETTAGSSSASESNLAAAPWGGLQPVTELRPEIIRSQHDTH
jgi:hypothetical protein